MSRTPSEYLLTTSRARRHPGLLGVWRAFHLAVLIFLGYLFSSSSAQTVGPLRVTSFQPTFSGFEAQFNRPPDTTSLNLYGTEAGGFGPPDVTVVGAVTGVVRGSLVLDTAGGVVFVKTGGPLEPDTYTVTLRSAANGFKDLDGTLLDGNDDGVAGDDFVATFVVPPPSGPIASIPDFTFGPGQVINVPFDGVGLPITLSDGTGVNRVEFTLVYDPSLLRIDTAGRGNDLPPDGTVTVETPQPGTITVRVVTQLGFPAGPVEVVRLGAEVPFDAPYRAVQSLVFSSLALNQGALSVIPDEGVHLVAYIGDTTGNAMYGSLDGQRILRVATGLDSGFAAYPTVDPVLVADITGNKTISSLDATRVLQEVVGLDRQEIPTLPAIASLSVVSGSVGQPVVIRGRAFDATPGKTRVTFNGIPGTVIRVTSDTIETFVPIGATSGPLVVRTDSGISSSNFGVTLRQDFALAATPDNGRVVQGSHTTFTVQLASTGPDPFSGLASLSASGLPQGVTVSFAPASLTAGANTTLIVNVSSITPTGTPSFLINATAIIDGRTVVRSAQVSLTVRAAGTTVLIGRVLDTGALPIPGVTLRVGTTGGNVEAVTDTSGNFLMQNPPVGDQLLLIVGGTANTSTKKYPTIPTNVTIAAGVVNQLPFTPHLHVQKDQDFTAIHPTQETVATDPAMPGVALRIPAGAQIVGWDGQPNSKVSMRTVPIDRLPVSPPPAEVSATKVYMFYFGKEGGGVATQPIPFTAPNDLGLAPGEKAELWYFDESPNPGEAPNDWRMAGVGTVSADGKTIVSDPGVGIPRFCCGAALWNPNRGNRQQPGPTPQQPGPTGGDPVDLSTGIFMLTATDMVLPGRIPVALTRTYRSGDSLPGPFGIGTTMSYDDALQRTGTDIITLVHRGNARTQFFRHLDGTLANTATPAFRGASISVTADGTSTLRFKDGAATVFDSRGLPIRVRDRNSNEVVIERRVEFNPTKLIEPSGRALNITWQILARDRATSVTDPLGRTVRYEYDGLNRLVRVIRPDGGVTQYGYDAQHRMTSITDPRGITFLRNTYDLNSRVCEQEQADGGKYSFYYITTDRASLPESIHLLQEAAAGGPISMASCAAQASKSTVASTVMVDPLGRATTYRFNGSGYVTSVTDALGRTTITERQPETNLAISITDPLGRTTRFEYDQAGNVTKIIDSAGNIRSLESEAVFNRITRMTDPLGSITAFSYDAQGNLITITDPLGKLTQIAYNSFGQPLSMIDPLGNVTSFGYDNAGNLTTLADPLGNTSRRAYDLVSRLIAQTDPRGRTTGFTYDALNRITQIVDAAKGTTGFAYDSNGNLLSVTDARNNSTTYAYDSMDRIANRTDPLGAAETLEYDAVGNLTRHTDRKGQVNTFTYDRLNRRVGANYADGATSSFTYDSIGRLAQATDSVGRTILNSYDILDRLISQTTTLGMIEYTYDALGRRTEMRVTGQSPVVYTYDAASRLRTITQAPLNPVTIDYDDLGRRTRLALPNGVSTEYRYDAASRVAEMIYRNATGILGNLAYQYDPAGNRVGVDGTFARTLLPDPVATATYDAANRQFQFGNKAMTFDANGNLTSIEEPSGVTAITWDARNRLATLSAPGKEASFTYDPFGRRGSKHTNGVSTLYVYDHLDIVRELAGGRAINYVRSLNIDEPLVGGAEQYLADALGASIALTDLGGSVQTEYSYEPFGRSRVTGPSANPFQYTGRENDGTGLHYYRARYYSPEFARFLSEDPIELAGLETNLYVYVQNRPTVFTDPTGLQSLNDGLSVSEQFRHLMLVRPSPLPPVPPGAGSLGSGVGAAPSWLPHDPESCSQFKNPVARALCEFLKELKKRLQGIQKGKPERPRELGDFPLPYDPSVFPNLPEDRQIEILTGGIGLG